MLEFIEQACFIDKLNIDKSHLRTNIVMGCPLALYSEDAKEEYECSELALDAGNLIICLEQPYIKSYGVDIHVYYKEEPIAMACDMSIIESLEMIKRYVEKYS